MGVASPAVCPRCRRKYPRRTQVCSVDGERLVEPREPAETIKLVEPELRRTAETNTPPATAVPDEPLERLGVYRLLRQLGEGGMARIYLAEHVKLGRIVAIKRLHSAHFTDRITVGRFLREARAVSDVRHPNLVTVYDVVEEPNEIYLVMEYLEGRDMAHVLNEDGPLSPERAAALFAQACDGLRAVHSRNIIHRDLKPENLFLARDGHGRERVKLLDFGVARLMEDRPRDLKTKSGETVGTPAYMSPEQATASEIDPRSDIYMLGVVLYEMITGVPPFVGKGYGEVMLMHVHDPPPPPSSRGRFVPTWLEQVVMKCLAKEPDDRYQNAKELALALRRDETAEVTMPARRVSLSAGLPATKTWALLIGSAALLVLTLVVTVITVMTPRASAGPSQHVAPPPPPPSPSLPSPSPQPPQVVVTPLPVPVPSRAAPARLRVLTTPMAAVVKVATEPRCNAPCDVELPVGAAGMVEVSATAPGYFEERRMVDIGAPPPTLDLTLKRRPPITQPGVSNSPRPRTGKPGDRNATVDPFR